MSSWGVKDHQKLLMMVDFKEWKSRGSGEHSFYTKASNRIRHIHLYKGGGGGGGGSQDFKQMNFKKEEE